MSRSVVQIRPAGQGGKSRRTPDKRRATKRYSPRTRPCARAAVKRKTKETDIEVAVDLDGTGVVGRDRHRLPRPHARSAGAPLAHRHHGQGQGRPAHRPPPHHRGRRHRARPGGQAGARRHEGHHPLRRRARADGRGADARRASTCPGRPFLVFKVEFARDKVGAFDTELVQEWFQAFAMNAGITLHVETLVRHQRSSYCRVLLQGPGAGAARGGRRSIRAPQARCRRPRARWAVERHPGRRVDLLHPEDQMLM